MAWPCHPPLGAEMRVHVVCVALIATLVGCSVGSPGDDTDNGQPPASEVQPPQETEDDGATVARTEIEIRGRCRELPRQTDEGYVLIANLTAVNIGNVGVNAKVTVTWPRTPRARVLTFRKVAVDQGESAPIKVELPISDVEATGVQNAVGNGRRCTVRHRINGAFGTPTD